MRHDTERACAVCGELIPLTRPGNNTKYCSLKCARKAEAQQNISYIKRRASSHNKIGLYVCCAYKSKCALCGWSAAPDVLYHKGRRQHANGNEIHHITPVQEGGTDNWDNLILLCPNHHKAADLGLIDQDTLRKQTRPLERTEAEIEEAKSKCAAVVAAAIFGAEENS